MLRTYQFFDNGRHYITEEWCMLSQVRTMAQEMFGPETSYIDVLDEGVLVARLER